MGGFTSVNGMYWHHLFTIFVPLCIAPKYHIWIYASSLQVLEACMKNCGRRFHNEVGKFRFLNELVKVISPKVGNKSASADLRSSA